MRAIVKEIFPGTDGSINQALVRTTSAFKHPAVKKALINIEVDQEQLIFRTTSTITSKSKLMNNKYVQADVFTG